jgi:acylphosphatase
MVASCRRGPVSARVDKVDDEKAEPDALGLRYAGEDFSVLPTI